MKDGNSISFSGGKIYTLAQNGTAKNPDLLKRRSITVHGEGFDVMNKICLHSRTQRKQISQTLALSIIDIGKDEGNEKLMKTLWNTYYCMHEVHVCNGRVHTKYCKNRICIVCLCIRKAEIINKYLDVIQSWNDAHFLTLTIRAVKKEKLWSLLRNMIKGIKRIIARYRKRNRRKNAIRLIGIRSLECEFNPIAKTYNPHFHMIVNCQETGIILRREWVKESKKKSKTIYAELWCQDLQKVTDPVKCLIEIVKYGSKIFSETDVEKKAKEGGRVVYAKALYTILEAMQGLRLFDRFGFNLPANSKKRVPITQTLREYSSYIFEPDKTDWIETETQIALTEFIPDPKISYVLENCINTELC